MRNETIIYNLAIDYSESILDVKVVSPSDFVSILKVVAKNNCYFFFIFLFYFIFLYCMFYCYFFCVFIYSLFVFIFIYIYFLLFFICFYFYVHSLFLYLFLFFILCYFFIFFFNPHRHSISCCFYAYESHRIQSDILWWICCDLMLW
jgi:hypothetical protein